MSTELAPCPFCGGAAHLLTGMVEFVDVEVRCWICAAMGGNENDGATLDENRAAAIAAWNRRTPIKPSADTGELRGEVNGLLARYFPEILIDQNGSAYGVSFVVREQRAALTGAILDLIQSEKAGSPIGQNDQPGLAFSDAGEP